MSISRLRATTISVSHGRRLSAARPIPIVAGWRRGIGARILEACEGAAVEAGFTRLEMGATLTGVPFYLAKGYRAVEDLAVALPGGEALPIVRMEKTVGRTIRDQGAL